MDFLEYSLISSVILCFICLTWYLQNIRTKTSVPTNWPLIGMLPSVLLNIHRIHEHMTQILIEVGGTFVFRGPLFFNMDMLITSDPSNIHHILSKNFSNYPKGPEFRKIFDILGNGIFNVDDELWEVHKKTTISLLNNAKFQTSLEKNTWDTIEKGLIPLLEYFDEQGMAFDLQEILHRFAFDAIAKLVLDTDPKSLSISLPHVPSEKATDDAFDALIFRHIMPESLWKLQKWLGIGNEKKLTRAWEAVDQFVYSCISKKQEEMLNKTIKEEAFTFITTYIKMYNNQWKKEDLGSLRKFLRDTFWGLIFAGGDSTSGALTWFFWYLAKNPLVVKKIREEIQQELHLKEDENLKYINVEQTRKLVYLHGALCETLRLFPSVSINHKTPLESDILPSGHRVNPNTKMLLSFWSMGRMQSVWGSDCLEFKPERWITKRGKTKYEPSFKFTAFNAGPRTCLGKELAFIEMKLVAASIVYNYDIKLVEGQTISLCSAIVVKMKNGLMVRASKRVHS